MLAKKGLGKTSPNPMVGCVIVKNGRIIGDGYHKKAGFPHAEIEALNKAGKDAKGATLYVNLEPCSHYGRTPPCTDAIIKAGIKRVVASCLDVNPIVNGKKILERKGIKVNIGLLKDEGHMLNEVYFKYTRTKMPFVILKVGMSLDGRISQGSESQRVRESGKWITSEASRKIVHRLRSQVDGIMVGKGTIIKDNPYLTTRLVKGKSPIRIVVTTDGKIPINSNVFGRKEDLIIASTKKPPFEIAKNAEIIIIKEENGMVSLPELLLKLGERGITSILLEGGQRLIASFLNRCLIDKAIFFISPKLIGDDGLSLLKDIPPLELKNVKIGRISEDIMVSGYFNPI